MSPKHTQYKIYICKLYQQQCSRYGLANSDQNTIIDISYLYFKSYFTKMTTSQQQQPSTPQATLGLWNDLNRYDISRDIAIIPGDFTKYKQQVVMSITLPDDYAE